MRKSIAETFGPRALRNIAQWEFVKKLGTGGSGVVYLIQDPESQLAIKFQFSQNKYEVLYEVYMQLYFARLGLAPKVHGFDIWRFHGKLCSLIIMDHVNLMMEQYLKTERSKATLDNICSQLDKIIDSMCKHKVRHNDLHFGNFGFVNKKIVLIDFGKASIGHRHCTKSGEYLQLARTLRSHFQTNMFPANKRYLAFKMLHALIGSLNQEHKSLPAKIKTVEDLSGLMDLYVSPLRPSLSQKTKFIKSLSSSEWTYLTGFDMERHFVD